MIVLIIILMISAGYVVATLFFPGLLPSEPQPARAYCVVYRVTGATSSAELTYRSASGMAETQVVRTEGHTLDDQPWEYQLELDYGQFIYVSAESREEHGTIGCEILIDDQVVEKATSRDSYVVATCGGSAGK